MKPTDDNSAGNSPTPTAPACPPRQIEIVYKATEAQEVFVAGDFNQWNQGVIDYVDPDATGSPVRFYRAVPIPDLLPEGN